MINGISIKLPTLISSDRLANIIKYSEYASRLQGAVIECGVYKGGSLELIAKLNPGTDVFGIDSFTGLPDTAKDYEFHKQSDFDDVNYLGIAGYFKMLYTHVKILKGLIPAVFDYFDANIRFRFCHIDLDLYESITDALNFFVPRMVNGGVILLDDYKVKSTPGCERAINDFFAETDIPVSHRQELKYFDTESSDSNGQYLIVK
jgi:O-methyltransferase